jgi:hypothetical protein
MAARIAPLSFSPQGSSSRLKLSINSQDYVIKQAYTPYYEIVRAEAE